MRNKHHDDDDNNNKFLRDGERRRVPMIMRDSWRNDMHRYLTGGRDVLADGLPLSRHKPHFHHADEAALDAKEQAYIEVNQRDAEAWRGTVSDTVTTGDAVAHDSAMAITDAKERAYALQEIEDTNAWRKT